ncbi:MAG: PTS sugar transporter subunit IIC, partial [Clostridia bacterium]
MKKNTDIEEQNEIEEVDTSKQISDVVTSNDNAETKAEEVTLSRKKIFLSKTKLILTHIFIDGLSGMAFGLFATLIVGTIICQIASLIGKNFVGDTLSAIGSVAKVLMGAGIGIGVAVKFKKSTLLVVSCAVAGMVGAYASKILSGGMFEGSVTTLVGVGEPLGAFISAYVAMSVGALVDGKTKIDILITPLVAILSG